MHPGEEKQQLFRGSRRGVYRCGLCGCIGDRCRCCDGCRTAAPANHRLLRDPGRHVDGECHFAIRGSSGAGGKYFTILVDRYRNRVTWSRPVSRTRQSLYRLHPHQLHSPLAGFSPRNLFPSAGYPMSRMCLSTRRYNSHRRKRRSGEWRPVSVSLQQWQNCYQQWMGPLLSAEVVVAEEDPLELCNRFPSDPILAG